jgi:septal ring factor EnvC (AmiA/AmiB activator)
MAKQVEQVQSQLAAVLAEKGALEGQVHRLSTEAVTAHEVAMSNVAHALAESNQRAQESDQKRNQLQQQVAQLHSDAAAASQARMGLEGQLRLLGGQVESLQQELQATRKSNQQKVEMLQQQLNNSSAGQDDTRRKMRAYVEQLSGEKDTAETTVVGLRAELMASREETELSNAKVTKNSPCTNACSPPPHAPPPNPPLLSLALSLSHTPPHTLPRIIRIPKGRQLHARLESATAQQAEQQSEHVRSVAQLRNEAEQQVQMATANGMSKSAAVLAEAKRMEDLVEERTRQTKELKERRGAAKAEAERLAKALEDQQQVAKEISGALEGFLIPQTKAMGGAVDALNRQVEGMISGLSFGRVAAGASGAGRDEDRSAYDEEQVREVLCEFMPLAQTKEYWLKDMLHIGQEIDLASGLLESLGGKLESLEEVRVGASVEEVRGGASVEEVRGGASVEEVRGGVSVFLWSVLLRVA